MNKAVLIAIVIVILGIGGYFVYTKYFKKTSDETSQKATLSTTTNSPTASASVTDNSSPQSKTFKNNDLGVELSYASDWTYIDLGGIKNVTEPLVRENVAYFQIANENADDTLANVKLLRFVLEDDANIQTKDDWYNYIKEKVDAFVENTTLSANYEPVSLEIANDIDNKFTVEEKYIEDDKYTGKDIYIYNGSDFYQFVTKIKSDLISKYQSSLDAIINSLKISNE